MSLLIFHFMHFLAQGKKTKIYLSKRILIFDILLQLMGLVLL